MFDFVLDSVAAEDCAQGGPRAQLSTLRFSRHGIRHFNLAPAFDNIIYIISLIRWDIFSLKLFKTNTRVYGKFLCCNVIKMSEQTTNCRSTREFWLQFEYIPVAR